MLPQIYLVPFCSSKLPSKTNYNKSGTLFCSQKTAEDNSTKINVSPNIPCTFLLSKSSAFLQIFFPRNLLFQQVLRTSAFLNGKCLTFLYLLTYLFDYWRTYSLKTSNKRTQVPFLIIKSHYLRVPQVVHHQFFQFFSIL